MIARPASIAKVDPDLVARDEKGTPYTVRYEAVNAVLLNEFLKEHHKVEAQGRRSPSCGPRSGSRPSNCAQLTNASMRRRCRRAWSRIVRGYWANGITVRVRSFPSPPL